MECPHAYRKIGISISLPRMSIFEGKTRKNAWVEGSIWKKIPRYQCASLAR